MDVQAILKTFGNYVYNIDLFSSGSIDDEKHFENKAGYRSECS